MRCPRPHSKLEQSWDRTPHFLAPSDVSCTKTQKYLLTKCRHCLQSEVGAEALCFAEPQSMGLYQGSGPSRVDDTSSFGATWEECS